MRRTKSTRALPLVLMAAMLGSNGCIYLPRVPRALSEKAQPPEMVALLPLTTNQVGDAKPGRARRLVKLSNKALDSLARSKEGLLIGPSRVSELLSGDAELLALANGLPQEERWEDLVVRSQFRDLAAALGANVVVSSRLSVDDGSDYELFAGGGGVGISRTTYVGVVMDTQRLEPPVRLKPTSSWGDRGVTTGVILYFPVFWGETLGRAVDRYFRKALTKVCTEVLWSDSGHDPQGEVGDEVEDQDGNLVVRQVPEVGPLEEGFVEAEELPVPPADRVAAEDEHD